MSTVLPNHFDRGKPFYPLVVNYTVQLLGFKELAILALTGPRDPNDLVSKIPTLQGIPPGKEAEGQAVVKNLAGLIGPLELRSEYLDDTIQVDVNDIAREVAINCEFLSAQLMKSAGSLLILAHEISRNEPWHDKGPLWEFLRHCRNAAAHGSAFHFLHGEPRRPACWGAFQITPVLQGTALFKRVDSSGFLSPGDPIRLLWDIEQAYPAMKA